MHIRTPQLITLFIALSAAVGAPVLQADQSFVSSSAQARLVELFTSQGCSSCPPADQWLSVHLNRDDLWTHVVPVAFHVTYWDYLGWRDPFGSRAHDDRQRRLAAADQAGVYTPGVFVNHREWRRWYLQPAGVDEGSRQQVGVLEGTVNDSVMAVRFTPSQHNSLDKVFVEIAGLGKGRTTDVGAGENHGRTLAESFIAQDLTRAELRRKGNEWRINVPVNLSGADGVAFWVRDGNGSFLQATGGWLN